MWAWEVNRRGSLEPCFEQVCWVPMLTACQEWTPREQVSSARQEVCPRMVSLGPSRGLPLTLVLLDSRFVAFLALSP